MAELTNESVTQLNSSLQQFTDIAKQMQEQMSGVGDETQYIYDNSKKINKEMEKSSKSLKQSESMVKSIFGKTKELILNLTAAKFTFTLAELVRSSFEIESNMMKLAVRMGKGREEGFKLYQTFGRIQQATGRSREEVETMVTVFGEGKFQGDLESMSTHMLRFAKTTGLGYSEAGQLALQLSRVGGVGDKAIMQITAGMANIQQKVGISRDGMSALTDQIQQSAFNMAALGKSEVDIALMATRTTALVAALEKVGVAAHDSVQMIADLTDPDRIEDNIALYSQLGISIQDALGGGDITDQIGAGLQEMASKAAAMGPIAGAQYAKAFGQSYSKLMKINQSNVTGEMAEAMEDAQPEDPMQKMIELQQQTYTTLDTMTSIFNEFEGMLRKIQPLLLLIGGIVITIVLPAIAKKIKEIFTRNGGTLKSASVETAAALEKGVGDGLGMGAKKSGDLFKERFAKIHRGISEDYIKNMKESSRYVTGQMEADYLSLKKSVNQFGIGKAFAESGENFVRFMSEGIPLGQSLEGIITNVRKREVERFQIHKEEQTILNEQLNKQKQTIGERLTAIKAEGSEYDKLIKSTTKLTPQEESRLKIYEKEIKTLNNQNSTIDEKIAKTVKNITGEEAILKMSTTAGQMQIKIMKEQTEAKRKELTEAKTALGVTIERADLEERLAVAMSNQVADLVEEIEDRKKNNLATGELETKLIKVSQEHENILESAKKLNKEVESQKAAQEQLNKEVTERAALEDKISGILDGRKQEMSSGGLVNNLTRLVNGLGRGLMNTAADFGEKIKNTAASIGASISKSLSAIRRNPIKATVAGLGKLGGAIGKLGIPMMILGVIMKFVQPILENLMSVLGPMFDTLSKVFGPIIEKLVKALMPPLLRLLAALWPLLTKIAWIAGMLIGAIGHLIKILSFGLLADVGNGLIEAGSALKELDDPKNVKAVQDGLNSAADSIKTSNLQQTKATEENTAAVEKNNGPVALNATGSGFSRSAMGETQSVTSSSTQSQAQSTARVQERQTSGIETLVSKFDILIGKFDALLQQGQRGLNVAGEQLSAVQETARNAANNSGFGRDVPLGNLAGGF